jgi:hypothetical protein
MKKYNIRAFIYIVLINLLSVGGFSQTEIKNQAILKIYIVKRKSDSKKIFNSGNGFLISKEGQFVTSYELIRDAIKYPRTYKIKVINNNDDELIDIKLASCGNKENIDICLLKANYTIINPFQFAKNSLSANENIMSTTLLKKNSISSNKGAFLNYETYKGSLHVKSTIPFTAEFLGSPIINNKKEVAAMISHTSGTKKFDSINKYIAASVIESFIADKQEFKEIGSPKNTSHKVSRTKNLKGTDINEFIKQRTKELKRLLAEFKKGNNSQKGVPQIIAKRRKLKQAEQNVSKVKKLMKKKDDVKTERENELEKLIRLQEELAQKNSEKATSHQKMLSIKKEISSLENNNRENTLKIALNKKKIKNIEKTSEVKMVLKANGLMIDNINLTDSRIKKLKSDIKHLIEKNKKPQKGKPALQEKIKATNSRIQNYDEQIKSLDAKAFDYFNDAI